jgi:hypothetical protein
MTLLLNKRVRVLGEDSKLMRELSRALTSGEHEEEYLGHRRLCRRCCVIPLFHPLVVSPCSGPYALEAPAIHPTSSCTSGTTN